MIDADAFARLLCDWSLELRPGQQVLVETPVAAMPLARALHRAALERGAWPLMRFAAPEFDQQFYRYAREGQLDSFAPVELSEMQGADAVIGILAPTDTKGLAGIDPALIVRSRRGREPVRAARRELRWCGTQWPTPALAEQAQMSEADYEAFLTRALFLDRPDPVEAWRELSHRQERIVEELSGGREVRIEAEQTDLRLRLDGRTWINSNGKRNMPSGEVFTGPVENSATGTIYFSVPSFTTGVGVEGIRLTFEQGKVVQASAERGEDYLQAALETDSGARFVGELGIGTNVGIDRPTGSTLLDEKIAGTIHLALGRSYPETGGVNESALHWDMVCDLRGGGRLSIDDQAVNDIVWPVG